MENKEENVIFYTPAIRSFKDTGFVAHGFGDGSQIKASVVPTNDIGGFAIKLEVKDDSGNKVCDFTMDRFSALCMTQALIQNLMNQEELVYNEYNNKNESFNSRMRQRGTANTESEGLGTREEN